MKKRPVQNFIFFFPKLRLKKVGGRRLPFPKSLEAKHLVYSHKPIIRIELHVSILYSIYIIFNWYIFLVSADGPNHAGIFYSVLNLTKLEISTKLGSFKKFVFGPDTLLTM